MPKPISANPFRYAGSYLGFLLGLLPNLTIILNIFGRQNELYKIWLLNIPLYLNPFTLGELTYCRDAGCGLVGMFTAPFVCFIYGWLIHWQIKKHYLKK
jgi:hypothetical protein